jgi:hypothetical protein
MEQQCLSSECGKRFETHRCVMDFDSSFCKAVFHSDDGEDVIGAAIIVNERASLFLWRKFSHVSE